MYTKHLIQILDYIGIVRFDYGIGRRKFRRKKNCKIMIIDTE